MTCLQHNVRVTAEKLAILFLWPSHRLGKDTRDRIPLRMSTVVPTKRTNELGHIFSP